MLGDDLKMERALRSILVWFAQGDAAFEELGDVFALNHGGLEEKFLNVGWIQVWWQDVVRGQNLQDDSEFAVFYVNCRFDVREIVLGGFLLQSAW